jgi:molybdopterin synthase catalytic subunit
MTVRLLDRPFDIGSETAGFIDRQSGAGGIVTFTGIVRDSDEGELQRMEIEHYPGMTESALEDIRTQAMSKWSLMSALIVHRYGSLGPGETIMMVATAARHRADAFAAAEFLMDYLKSRAPFWKKEITQSGSTWVASRDCDEEALSRWS